MPGHACRKAVDVCLREAAAAGIRIVLAAFDGETAACLRKPANGELPKVAGVLSRVHESPICKNNCVRAYAITLGKNGSAITK